MNPAAQKVEDKHCEQEAIERDHKATWEVVQAN